MSRLRWGPDRGISEYGPCYQFECLDCGHMSECYDTLAKMRKRRNRHKCRACTDCGGSVIEATGEEDA